MTPAVSPKTTAGRRRCDSFTTPLLRLVVCLAVVLAITGLRFAIHVQDARLLTAALNFFLIAVLAVAIRWGTAYTIFLSVLSGLAFSWTLPPAGHFHFSDARVWTLFTACLVTGVVASQLSHRARVEALHARRSEKELRDVIETIPAIAWSAFPDGSNAFANRRWTEYTGLPGEQTAGSGWQISIHPDDLPQHLQKWQASLASGEPFEVEVRMRRSDNQYRWHYVHGIALRDENGQILKWYGISTDVEERRQAQEALRRSEAYLAEGQKLAHTGSFAFNPNTNRVRYWSEENFRIWGFDPQHGFPDRDMIVQRIHPEDRDRFVEVTTGAFRKQKDYAVEVRIVLPDGTIQHIRSLGHPVVNSSGELEVVGTHVNITERKRAEEEHEKLRQLEVDLAHMNRVSILGELAASLAHEIRQPITAALLDAGTCLEWLGRDEPDIDEARQAVSRITLGVTRASDIISRLRSLFKKEEPQREPIDLNDVVREIIVLLRSEAARHRVSIHTELATDLPVINADRVQLQQVLMNLMLNAIDAMKNIDTPGELTIKTHHSTNGQLMVVVSDVGSGIPSDQASKIFDAFFTTKAQGTGMGLSISRSIIEAHGGRLWATANSPRGSTFQFTLPSEVKAA